ncbi:MAG: hypothetical protein LAO20_14885 [Acidobacteriia bacterium]|nr:hypothetical protein [Terriglobia bacterium]
MTKTQVVRRKFKSALPRTIQNRLLSKMEAMARTMELFDRLRNEMEGAGLNKNHASAGLVFCQPETKGKAHVLAETIALPKPEEIGVFVERVMALDKPLFLGVLFIQEDPDADKSEQKRVAFVWPFMAGPEAEGRLLAARNQQARGGFKKVAN